MKDPIIITGCARSGTSMIAGLIEIAGANGGKTCGATRFNKRGQFENVDIINTVQKPYLERIGADPMGQYPLPEYVQLETDDGRRAKVRAIARDQGISDGEPWYFKDAKAAIDWTVWNEAFPNAKWVIVRRSKDQIIKSCERTSFMRKRKDWGAWVDFHEARFADMHASLKAFGIWPSMVMAGDLSPVVDLMDWLGLEIDESKARAFIDPSLYSGWQHG